jgi:hypothetical protein
MEGLAGIRQKYLNEDIGYGVTRPIVAEAVGVPIEEVDKLPDQVLNQVAARHHAAVNNMIRKNRGYNDKRKQLESNLSVGDRVDFAGAVTALNEHDKQYADTVDQGLAERWLRLGR